MIKIVNEKINSNGVDLNKIIEETQKYYNIDKEIAKTLTLWTDEIYPFTPETAKEIEESFRDGSIDEDIDEILCIREEDHGQTKKWKEVVLALWHGGKYEGGSWVTITCQQAEKAIAKYFNIERDLAYDIASWYEKERENYQEFIPFLEHINDTLGDKLVKVKRQTAERIVQALQEGGNWTGHEWNDQDYEEKGVKLKRIPKECIKGAAILSLEEAQSLSQEDLKYQCDDYWRHYWLCTPDSERFLFAAVRPLNGKIEKEDITELLNGRVEPGVKYYSSWDTETEIFPGVGKEKWESRWNSSQPGSCVSPFHFNYVRPVLKLSNIRSAGLKVGDYFVFGDCYRFKVIKNNLAICERHIDFEGEYTSRTRFDDRCTRAVYYKTRDYTNMAIIFEKDFGKYKGSLVDRIVNEWFNKNKDIEAPESYIRGDGRNPWLYG